MTVNSDDRVAETTTTSGTGTLNLDGAKAGFQAFGDAFNSSDKVYYTIEDGNNSEVGIATFTDATPDTLSRDTVLLSIEGGVVGASKITLSGSAATVFATAPAAKLLIADENGLFDFAAGELHVKGQKLQAFTVTIQNDSGTIKHRIGRAGQASQSSNFNEKINGASTTLTATPTGTDSSTAMAAGSKRSSADNSILILDTGDITAADSLGLASVSFNSSGTDLIVNARRTSRNVNGTTITRLELSLGDTAGAAFNLNTSNIAAGKAIDITFHGFLK